MAWITGGLIWLAIWVVCIAGWIANIVKLCNYDVFGVLELARCIGIIAAPLGVVLGLFV